MTRINVNIRPSLLCREHLLAEHREMKRIPNKVSKGKYSLDNIPPVFKLGSGHEKFFYNKLLYLKNRYESVYSECIKRNLNVTYYGNAWDGVPPSLMKDYTPTRKDRNILVERINERILNMQEKHLEKNRFESVKRLEKHILTKL